MDERQQKIREGAGLEESRLNQEFIELLQKWSMPVLVVIAATAVGYAAWGKYQQARTAKINTAFRELESASDTPNPSPESLKRVADEYEGVRSVSLLARLEAADQYMRTLRAGVKPGAEVKPDGTLAKPEDALSEQDIAFNLAQAKLLYQRIFDEASAASGKELLTVSALYGLAAVAESKKDTDQAQAHYLKLSDIAEKVGYGTHATLARKRITQLDQIVKDIPLYDRADLPDMPWDLVGPPMPPPEAPPVVPPAPPATQGAENTLPPPAPQDPTPPPSEPPQPDDKPEQPAPAPAPEPQPPK